MIIRGLTCILLRAALSSAPYLGIGVIHMVTDRLGLIAARTFKSEEIITVYTGTDIGALDGELDEYKGYHTMDDLERRKKGNTGRHVMAIDGRLVDGYEGYTGAQYINTAYRDIVPRVDGIITTPACVTAVLWQYSKEKL